VHTKEQSGFRRWLIVADGEAKVHERKKLHHWMRGRQTVALDGAAQIFEKNRLLPEMLLGDFDSVDPDLLNRWQRQGVSCLRRADQDHTDLEKALQFTISAGAVDIVILNALGYRMDHTLANLFFLKKYARSGVRIVHCDGTQYVEYLQDETRNLQAPAGSYCGFFGLSEAIISSFGLKYEMKNFPVRLGFQESVSNEFLTTNAQIIVTGTCLAVYAVL
jgi:thiamine pyrophosphokinase